MKIADVLLCGHGPLIPISAELVGKGVVSLPDWTDKQTIEEA